MRKRPSKNVVELTFVMFDDLEFELVAYGAEEDFVAGD
jgi:hypothetical protein